MANAARIWHEAQPIARQSVSWTRDANTTRERCSAIKNGQFLQVSAGIVVGLEIPAFRSLGCHGPRYIMASFDDGTCLFSRIPSRNQLAPLCAIPTARFPGQDEIRKV